MSYFIALSILALAVLPALLSLAARAGYTGALLPLRNWEMLIFLIGATVAGSWYAFSNVGTGFTCPLPVRSTQTGVRSGQPRGLSLHKYLPWLFLMSGLLSTLVSGADLYQFWSMPFLALITWLMLLTGLGGKCQIGAVSEPPLLDAIRIAALLNAAVAFAQFFGLNPLFSPTTGGRPVTGLFDNPNRFGAFLAIAMPLFFALHPQTLSRWERVGVRGCNYGGAALVGLALLLSRSTFAILAMMAALFYFVYAGTGLAPVCRSTGRPVRRTAIKAVPTLIAAAFVVTLIISVFLLDPPNRANLLRYQIYKKSVSTALERPILGHGLGQFEVVFNARPPEIKDPPRRVTHAHNEYLELFVEQGLIGLAILAIFLWQLFCRAGVAPAGMHLSAQADLSAVAQAEGWVTLPLRASLIALMVNALGFYPMRVPLIAMTAIIVLTALNVGTGLVPVRRGYDG